MTRSAAEVILAERERQRAAEGYHDSWDDTFVLGELRAAGRCYLVATFPGDAPPPGWPWDERAWKPVAFRPRNLIRAAALLVAEMDRLRRLGDWLEVSSVAAEICVVERRIDALLAEVPE